MNLKSQIELELYFADHFDTILFPVLADLYLNQNDFRRARKVCDIGLKTHPNDAAGLFILAQIEKAEGNLKEAEKILEKVANICADHLAAAEMLCEIQTVLGRATNRLLKSWKNVLLLNPNHQTAIDFIKRVEKKGKVPKRTSYTTKRVLNEKDENRLEAKIDQSQSKLIKKPTLQDMTDPLKVSPRLATFTLVSVLKNQGLFSQALEVLDALESKGESEESISLERDIINTLIEKSKKE